MNPQSNSPTVPPVMPSPTMPSGSPGGTMPPPSTTPQVYQPSGRRFPKKLFVIALVIVLILGVGGLLFQILVNNPATKEANLVWWGLWEDEQTVAPLIAEYQQQHPNVKIKYERQSPQDYRERLINSLSQGRGPDIFRIHNTWAPMFKNQIEPLPASVMSSAEYKQTFYPVIASDFTDLTTGGILAMPLEIDTIAMFVNEEIFETQGKQIPQTWDQLLEVAQELTIKDESGLIRQSGAALGRTENVDHWQEIVGQILLQNNTNMTNPATKQGEDVIDYFTRFSKRGIWDQTLPNSTRAFASGVVAMYLGPSWRVHEIKLQNPDLRFKVVQIPQLRKGSPSDPNVFYATYWAESVWNKSNNPEAAWQFLKFMTTRESLEKFYKNASANREFGEPYSRVDMQSLLANTPSVSTFVGQAKEAKSWYLASRTFDGPTGINSQIGKYFEDAINSVNEGEGVENALKTVAKGLSEVLPKYGISIKK